MNYERIKDIFLPASAARELTEQHEARVSVEPTESAPAPLTAKATPYELDAWRSHVDRLATDQLLDMSWKLRHQAEQLGEDHYDHIRLYDVRGLDRPGVGFVIATADMVTQAIENALRAKGYTTASWSNLGLDPHTSSLALTGKNPDNYRSEISIDW